MRRRGENLARRRVCFEGGRGTVSTIDGHSSGCRRDKYVVQRSHKVEFLIDISYFEYYVAIYVVITTRAGLSAG